MTSNDIAFTAMIVSGSVGLAAVLGSFIGGFLDRRHARDLARADRNQTRIERTYLELIGYVHRRRMEANAIRPLMTFKDQLEPEKVTAEEIERVQSLVVANASQQIHDIIGEFAEAVADIHNADVALTEMESGARLTLQPVDWSAWGASPQEFHKRIHATQHKLTDIETWLHEQIRKELSN